MRLMSFVFGMVLAASMVVGWSVASGAGVGTTLLRLGLCLRVVQVGYALSVGLMAARERREHRAREAERAGEAECRPERRRRDGVIRTDAMPTGKDGALP